MTQGIRHQVSGSRLQDKALTSRRDLPVLFSKKCHCLRTNPGRFFQYDIKSQYPVFPTEPSPFRSANRSRRQADPPTSGDQILRDFTSDQCPVPSAGRRVASTWCPEASAQGLVPSNQNQVSIRHNFNFYCNIL